MRFFSSARSVTSNPLIALELIGLLAIIPWFRVVGTYRQDRYGNVRRADGLLLGVLSLAGAAGGVALANALSGTVLRDAFAALMVVVAVQLVHRTLRGEGSAGAGAAERPEPTAPGP